MVALLCSNYEILVVTNFMILDALAKILFPTLSLNIKNSPNLPKNESSQLKNGLKRRKTAFSENIDNPGNILWPKLDLGQLLTFWTFGQMLRNLKIRKIGAWNCLDVIFSLYCVQKVEKTTKYSTSWVLNHVFKLNQGQFFWKFKAISWTNRGGQWNGHFDQMTKDPKS